MRLRVANCHRVLLLLINLFAHGLTIDHKKYDFRKSRTGKNSLMDDMMRKYSYPKNEVTAGVGYGHHLHPMYYRGEREMMYPCAVECGEWEAMKVDDSANDGSSNVDVVTVHPDVSTIDLTTPKSRSYKDVSFLRPKKYQSPLFATSATATASPAKSSRNKLDFNYHDSKGADVQIIPQASEDGYIEASDTKKEIPNDGSLYAKYYDALVSGYDGELNSENNKENEDFDPVEESIGYNPPSFDDADSDDVEAPVYPTKTNSHPKRERIEEKYVKHNVREERLEDVRTNSFGSSGVGDDDYSPDSSPGKSESDGYDPSKYIDDYAAPVEPYNRNNKHPDYRGGSSADKPFRPSPYQGQAFQDGEKRPRIYGGHPRGPYNDKLYPFYEAGDYGEGVTDYDERPKKSGAYFNSAEGNFNFKQGRGYHRDKYQHGRVRDPRINRRPLIYGRSIYRNRAPPIPHPGNLRYPPKHGSYSRSLYSQSTAGHSSYPYAPRHGYLPQIQQITVRPKSGGITVVRPPQIASHPPFSKQGIKPPHFASGLRNGPYLRGQRVHYKRTIPQKDGFTKIVKQYRSIVDHTPKRYVRSGEPYVR